MSPTSSQSVHNTGDAMNQSQRYNALGSVRWSPLYRAPLCQNLSLWAISSTGQISPASVNIASGRVRRPTSHLATRTNRLVGLVRRRLKKAERPSPAFASSYSRSVFPACISGAPCCGSLASMPFRCDSRMHPSAHLCSPVHSCFPRSIYCSGADRLLLYIGKAGERGYSLHAS